MDCRKLAAAFYARVITDPILRPLFPGKSLRCATEEMAAFLVQILDGPPEDSQYRWWLSIRESHSRFQIGERERAAWMNHMNATLSDAGLADGPEELRSFFEQGSHYIAHAVPPASDLWQPQLALDKAVDAIAKGNANEAIEQTKHCARTVLPGLLARMIASHNPALFDFVHTRIRTDPSLVEKRYANQTLLHRASATGSCVTVEILLGSGADPNAHDSGAHTPLYSVANECRSPEGPAIVRALVNAGSRVDAAEGVQRCTALHMAARRGNIPICAVLLDCGATIDARDRRGDTPLRRAINCRQSGAVDFLRARGAAA
jgi:hemoglobin